MTEAEFVRAAFAAKKWAPTVLLEARQRIAKGEREDAVYQDLLTRKKAPQRPREFGGDR